MRLHQLVFLDLFFSYICISDVVQIYREGLSARSVSNSDEIQIRIDLINADLDKEVTDLRRMISQLKNVKKLCLSLLLFFS